VLSTHFCPEAATGLGFRFIAPHNLRRALRLRAARGEKRMMACRKHALAVARGSAGHDNLRDRPVSMRKRALCRRGIVMPRPPVGLDEIPDERSNSTPIRTRLSFHLSKSR